MQKSHKNALKIILFLVGIALIWASFALFPKPSYMTFAPGAILVWLIISPYMKTQQCSRCGTYVSMYARNGEKCPKCGAIWK